jgi:hypothetical protein
MQLLMRSIINIKVKVDINVLVFILQPPFDFNKQDAQTRCRADAGLSITVIDSVVRMPIFWIDRSRVFGTRKVIL